MEESHEKPDLPLAGGSIERPEAEVERLRRALEDVVTLSMSAGDLPARAAAMQRRAIAALTGRDAPPAPQQASLRYVDRRTG